MSISIKDSYNIMFSILENYFFENEKNDGLASLLGDMSPYTFSDNLSADPAAYKDWKTIIVGLLSNDMLSVENFILGMQNFLVYYQKSFGFDLLNIISYIKKNDALIKDYVQKNL